MILYTYIVVGIKSLKSKSRTHVLVCSQWYVCNLSDILVFLCFAFQMKSESLGEVLLQEQFTVWDPKQLIKKGRERHLFLFEMCLLFSKEIKDSTGKSKYQYKFKLMVSSVPVLWISVWDKTPDMQHMEVPVQSFASGDSILFRLHIQ